MVNHKYSFLKYNGFSDEIYMKISAKIREYHDFSDNEILNHVFENFQAYKKIYNIEMF
jgi:hypothetical protein